MHLEWQVAERGYRVCEVRHKKGGEYPEAISQPLDLAEIRRQLAGIRSGRRGRLPWERNPDRWWITEGVQFGSLKRERQAKRYLMERHSALFQQLASTSPNLEGILGFANQYGLLKSGPTSENMICDPTSGMRWYAERLSSWVYHIYRLRWANEAWNQAKENDVEKLAKRIHYDKSMGILYRGSPEVKLGSIPECPTLQSQSIIVRSDSDDDLVKGFERSHDFVEAGYRYVIRAINDGVRIVPGQKAKADSIRERRQAFPLLRWDPQARRPQLELEPENLIAGVWLQFAHAVAEAKKYRCCQQCGTWFLVGEIRPGQKRRGRETRQWCGDICRARASEAKRRARK